MNYHVFQKEIVNLCFPQKKKKSKIKITKIGKNVMSIAQIFMIQKLFALLAFQDEGCMLLHPKIMFILGYKCIDFSLYTTFPNLIFQV